MEVTHSHSHDIFWGIIQGGRRLTLKYNVNKTVWCVRFAYVRDVERWERERTETERERQTHTEKREKERLYQSLNSENQDLYSSKK